MNQVPHITIEQMEFIAQPWTNTAASVAEINTRIDAYNEKQSQTQYITADEARKLGAFKAEVLEQDGKWRVCGIKCQYPPSHFFGEHKYRAITPVPAQPHAELKALYEQQVKDGTLDDFNWEYRHQETQQWYSIDAGLGTFFPETFYRCTPKPTCQVQNQDTGELKTMTREAAKLLQGELGDTVEWWLGSVNMSYWKTLEFNSTGLYTYKLKANLVKLDGELMTRKAAIAKWESKKDTYSIWYRNNSMTEMWEQDPNHFRWNTQTVNGSEYELRERPLKQISWKDLPVGVMTNKGELLSVDNHRAWTLNELRNGVHNFGIVDLELAPADQQPWIVRHGTNPVDIFAVKGLVVQSKYVNGSMYVFKVTGIAKGYELK